VLRTYADEHVLSAIVEALRRRGMDVITVQEHQGEGTDDAAVLEEALRESRVVLTNDADFLVLAARHAVRQEAFAPIFFWPQQRRRVGDVVRSIVREATRNDYAAIYSQVVFL
jgi:hypothetical protein